MATAIPDERSQAEPPCLGYVFYAPPRAVPRAQRFPTGPVSADAVLLTSMGIEPGPAADDLPHALLARVIDELVRRGVRALEAFGRTPPRRSYRIRAWWVPICVRCWRPSVIARWTTA